MIKKIVVFFVAAMLTLFILTPAALAFDGNNYGGGYSGGGSSGGNSSGSYSSGGEFVGNYDSGGGSSPFYVFAVLVVYLGYRMVRTALHSYKTRKIQREETVRRSSDSGMFVRLPDRTAQVEGLIRVHDANFSADSFLSFAKRMYVEIQTAWCRRDMAPVRHLLHGDLYDTTALQVQSKIDQGVVYHYKNIVTEPAYLTSYARDGRLEYATVYLRARMIDWQEDEKTGTILRGDKTTRWELRYKMKFVRPSDQVTNTAGDDPTGQCGWVLFEFETIKDDTVDEGIRWRDS